MSCARLQMTRAIIKGYANNGHLRDAGTGAQGGSGQ